MITCWNIVFLNGSYSFIIFYFKVQSLPWGRKKERNFFTGLADVSKLELVVRRIHLQCKTCILNIESQKVHNSVQYHSYLQLQKISYFAVWLFISLNAKNDSWTLILLFLLLTYLITKLSWSFLLMSWVVSTISEKMDSLLSSIMDCNVALEVRAIKLFCDLLLK